MVDKLKTKKKKRKKLMIDEYKYEESLKKYYIDIYGEDYNNNTLDDLQLPWDTID